jgi:hypothetical protein
VGEEVGSLSLGMLKDILQIDSEVVEQTSGYELNHSDKTITFVNQQLKSFVSSGCVQINEMWTNIIPNHYQILHCI